MERLRGKAKIILSVSQGHGRCGKHRQQRSEDDGAYGLPGIHHEWMGTHYLRFLQRRKSCPSRRERKPPANQPQEVMYATDLWQNTPDRILDYSRASCQTDESGQKES